MPGTGISVRNGSAASTPSRSPGHPNQLDRATSALKRSLETAPRRIFTNVRSARRGRGPSSGAGSAPAASPTPPERPPPPPQPAWGEVRKGGKAPLRVNLGHVETAVDVDELAGDPACLGGGEEDRDAGDFLGLGDAPEGNLTRPFLDLRFCVAIARLRSVGETGSDGVDANAVGRQGQGHG